MPQYLSLSVHGLVDFLLRKGDIDNRIYNVDTMLLGTKIHAQYQKSQGKTYLAEHFMFEKFVRPLGVVELDGRADGIILDGKMPIIDEIKSTVDELNNFYSLQKEWHLGQAKCYALMYAHETKQEVIGVRLTYISQINSDRMVKNFTFRTEELEEYVNNLIDQYLSFFEKERVRKEERNTSSTNLPFPYGDFRPGQRKMAKCVYSTAKNGGLYFLEAPTGIGKTISALYPSILSFGEGNIDKIFYLTAKTTGRESAFKAMGDLYDAGFSGRDSLLVAKDKICFKQGASCNPDECPFAKSYYEKIRQVIEEATSSGERFSQEYVTALAKHHAMCPFELQLDLSLYSDVIICDYNYLFDPMVYLERFFDDAVDSSKYFALVDEAHNLLERGRDMYSATVSKIELLDVKKSLSKIKCNSIKRALTKIEKAIDEATDLDDGELNLPFLPDSLLSSIESLDRAYKKHTKDEGPKLGTKFKNFRRELNRFSFLNENYNDNAEIFLSDEGSIVLYCLDPSEYLRASVEKLKGAVLFSATLSPFGYFEESILGKTDVSSLALPSPFPKENFCLMIAPISTRYRHRENTMQKIAGCLETYVSAKKGNYFIYFPSYEYMYKMRPYLEFPDCDVIMQNKEMDDVEREGFLLKFKPNPEKTTVGLVVIGGSFSEGIDLQADRLIGVAVVGIGLPKVCKEKEIIRRYYDEKNGKGFLYSYLNPGMNKIMQAVGRLIRSEYDIGSALLIDDRYLQNDYRNLFRNSWDNYEVVLSEDDITSTLQSFFAAKD